MYKLILMDCNMPVLDGFEATIEIRKLSELNQESVYISALTANSREQVKDECLNVGMNYVMTKPVSLD